MPGAKETRTACHLLTPMYVGYARVSTQEQTLDLQKDALEKIGCIKIFSDVVSGAKAERTGLHEALEWLCTKSPVRNLTQWSTGTFWSHFKGFLRPKSSILRTKSVVKKHFWCKAP